MFKYLAKITYSTIGWKSIGILPAEKKYIVVLAPHTSNWDFFYGRLFCISIGFHPKVLIKRELFFFPLGLLLKKLGGIPVFRESNNNLVGEMVDLFENTDHLILGIAPEGTRQKVSQWKSGFYFIALKAKIPIYLSFIDYKLKAIGILNKFEPTGEVDSDLEKIRSFYEHVTPRFPEKFECKKISF